MKQRVPFLLLALTLAWHTTAAQTTWTGTTNTNWSIGTNWSAGVPDATDDVTIPDVANDPVIMGGTAAVANSVSVNTSASLTINDMGSLTINGSSTHSGFTAGLYNEGTVENRGDIIIGSTASVGNYGIWNLAAFDNNSGGEISIDRSSFIGLYNVSGTFTNAAKITIGAVASVSNLGIRNEAAFGNNSGGEISIDRSSIVGLWNRSGTFTNAAKITIGAVASVGANGIRNDAAFGNNSGGEISIDRSSSRGLYNVSGTFTNAAKITIGAVASVGAYGIFNDAAFDNNACATLTNFAPFYNSNTFNNSGLFTSNTLGAHTNSGFTNNGILGYPQGNLIPNVTNNDVIAAPISGGCPVPNALTLGGSVSFIADANWYLDAALTQIAGTYNQAANTFTPTNSFPLNVATTVYFNITDNANGCPRLVSVLMTVTAACCIAPTFTACPTTGVSVNTPTNACTAVATYTATANGTTPTLTYAFTNATTGNGSGTGSGSTFNRGVTNVVITATNACGAPTCAFTVTVVDNVKPVITCPANATIAADANCSGTVGTRTLASKSDNCTASGSITEMQSPAAATTPPKSSP